jgi:hypothetical protein
MRSRNAANLKFFDLSRGPEQDSADDPSGDPSSFDFLNIAKNHRRFVGSLARSSTSAAAENMRKIDDEPAPTETLPRRTGCSMVTPFARTMPGS